MQARNFRLRTIRKNTVNMSQTKSIRKKSRKATGKKSRSKPAKKKKWSAKVTENSDALDLKSKVFKSKSPAKVAKSLKKSSDRSKRRKGTPLQSAMSMLNFYMNRAGKKLPARDRKVLNDAKDELRKLYGNPTKQDKK